MTRPARRRARRRRRRGSSEKLGGRAVDELIELMHLGRSPTSSSASCRPAPGASSTSPARSPTSPSVLLLDEPSSGIAQRETEALGPVLLDIREQTGAALLVIEHDMPLIRRSPTSWSRSSSGAVIAGATPDDVINHPRVVESYLGGRDAVINRSGNGPGPAADAAAGGRRAGARRREAPARGG